MIFKHIGLDEQIKQNPIYTVEWNQLHQPMLAKIPQTDLNRWVEEMVTEMLLTGDHMLTRICGDSIVVVLRDEDVDEFSVEVGKRVVTAQVTEIKEL